MAATITLPSASAEAGTPPRGTVDISARSLPDAIVELSREAAVSIGSDGPLPRLPTVPLRGRMEVGQALARLLVGSGYRAHRVGSTAWRIDRIPMKAAAPASHHVFTPVTPIDTVADAPITVTAAKRDQPLRSLPMNVSVVVLAPNDQHDPSLATDWIAGEIEGLSQVAAGPGRNRMFLRGIADSPFNGESESTIAILLDDARLTYAAPDPGIRLVDVQRVEVLKGPQGSLYGAGSLGGIFQIVTHRADLAATTLSVAAGGQVTVDGGAGPMGSAVINLPVVSGRAALRLVSYAAQEPGWIDTGQKSNSNASNVSGARLGLGVDLGDGWRLDATGFGQWSKVLDSQYTFSREARTRPAQTEEPHVSNVRHMSLHLANRIGSTQVVMQSAMTWQEISDSLNSDDTQPFGDGQVLTSSRRYRVWDNEVRGNGEAGIISWLAGISHLEARQTALQTAAGISPVIPRVIDDDRRQATDSAVFGDVSVALGHGLKVDLGGRLFRSGIREIRKLPTGPVVFQQSRTGLTPSGSLSWEPHAGRLFYVRYGSASRQGGLDIRRGGQLERLRSDELSNLEAGWREITARAGQLDVNAYVTWWDHLQSDTLLPDGENGTMDVGHSHIVGLEATYTRSLGRDWRLTLGSVIQHADLARTEGGMRLRNRRLPIVPDYTLRAALQRNFKLFGAPASLRGVMRYIGPARLSFDPALNRPVAPILESRLEGHLAIDTFDLSLRVENFLDRSGDTYAFGNPLLASASGQYTLQRPFTAIFSVLRQF